MSLARAENYLSFPKFSPFYLCSLDLKGKNDLVIQCGLVQLPDRGGRGQADREGARYVVPLWAVTHHRSLRGDPCRQVWAPRFTELEAGSESPEPRPNPCQGSGLRTRGSRLQGRLLRCEHAGGALCPPQLTAVAGPSGFTGTEHLGLLHGFV